MGIWDKIATAEVYGQGNYFKPGFSGDVEIVRCLTKDTRENGVAFIVECKVASLDQANQADHPVGQQRTWFQGMEKYPESALSAVKEFMLGVFGIPLEDTAKADELGAILPGMMEQVCGESNVLKGRRVHLYTFNKVTKKKGNDFTVHRWSPATPLRIAAS